MMNDQTSNLTGRSDLPHLATCPKSNWSLNPPDNEA